MGLAESLTAMPFPLSFVEKLWKMILSLNFDTSFQPNYFYLFTGLSNRSISYISKNLTKKIRKVSFADEKGVNDIFIIEFVQRCINLVHLDLRGTSVTYTGVCEIIRCSSNTLISLSLPEILAFELGLLGITDFEKLGKIGSMPRLKYLDIGDVNGFVWPRDEDGNMTLEMDMHVKNMEAIFPHLKINHMTHGDDPICTDPNYDFYHILDGFPQLGICFQSPRFE